MSSLRLTPLILAVALFMENMDSTVIATSLAEIARDIGQAGLYGRDEVRASKTSATATMRP